MSQNFETFTESGVEADFLRWLDDLGWTVYGEGRTWGATILDNKHQREHTEPVYWNLLKKKVIELNDDITEDNVDRFISSLKQDLTYEDLMQGNQEFHTLLIRGKKFALEKGTGETETQAIQLVDLENLEKNSLIAANQFRIRNKKYSKRPDVNLFVNGIPLVTMELKSSTSNNDYYDAIQDIHDYEDTVPRLFAPALLNVAADSREMRYGSIGATTKHYYPWNENPYEESINLKETVQALLNPETVIDILDNFVIYREKKGSSAKLIPRYMQYYASKKLLDRAGIPEKDRGLIWHTQGSGKSLTMLYTAKNLINRDVLENPQVLVLVDREKLEEQMRNKLTSIDFEQFDIAETGEHLQELLESGKSSLILTTIHKFQNVRNDSQGNPETVVLTDEAHRFMEKDLGSKLDAVLPDCMHFGFTGTPVRESERNTFEHYSEGDELYLDYYSMKQGIQDDLILPVFFDERSAVVEDYDKEQIDKEFERHVQALPEEDKSKVIQKSVTKKDIEQLRPRIEEIAEDIHEHFKAVEKNGFKGMVVAPYRHTAALYGEILQEKRGSEEVKVLISGAGKQTESTKKFETTPEDRESIVEDIHNKENPKLVVVCNMLLTGFDEPDLKTIYLDRELRNHSLLQAIARTNRIQDDKNNGEIVDYRGVFDDIDKALDYGKEVQETAAIDKDKLFTGDEENDITGFEPLLEELVEIFDGIEKKDSTETIEKALTRLNKDPEKKQKFLKGMRKLQDLYESISPDPRLVTEEVQSRYKWLNQVKLAFNADKTDTSKKHQREEIREKTQEILEKHIDIDEVRDDFGTYKLNEKYLEDLEGLEPSVKATKVATATKHHLDLHRGENPEYHRLSERLDEVLERWQADEITDTEAVKQLEKVEEETLAVEEEAEEKAMKDYEHAFFKAFSRDYSEYVNEEEAQELAERLGEKFREEVDTSFPNWHQNESVRREFNRGLLDLLVKEYDYSELYSENKTSLREDLWMYLVENTV